MTDENNHSKDPRFRHAESKVHFKVTSELFVHVQGHAKNVPAKFSEESTVWADWLCTGCLDQWAAGRRENANMQEFFFARHCTPAESGVINCFWVSEFLKKRLVQFYYCRFIKNAS